MTTSTPLDGCDIVDFSVAFGSDWYRVELSPERAIRRAWATQLSGTLLHETAVSALLAGELEDMSRVFAELRNPAMTVAVWIPTPESGRASTAVSFELTPLVQGQDPEWYLSTLEADRGRREPGVQYLEVSTWTGELDAGSFVAAHNLIARRDLRDADAALEERTVFGVFIPGARQMIQFVFSAESIGAFVNMPLQTQEFLAGLTVKLGDPQ